MRTEQPLDTFRRVSSVTDVDPEALADHLEKKRLSVSDTEPALAFMWDEETADALAHNANHIHDESLKRPTWLREGVIIGSDLIDDIMQELEGSAARRVGRFMLVPVTASDLKEKIAKLIVIEADPFLQACAEDFSSDAALAHVCQVASCDRGLVSISPRPFTTPYKVQIRRLFL